MEAVLRTTAIYGFILLIFRITGKHSLGQLTSFDFVLLLIIGDSAQQALLGDDFSLTNAFIVITTIFFLDIISSLLQQRIPGLRKIFEDVPVLLMEKGRFLQTHMEKEEHFHHSVVPE